LIINKAYKFRIYPNLSQQKQLYKEFLASKVVYNYYLDKTIEEYKNNKKTLNYYDWAKDLTNLKKQEEYQWLQTVSIAALQQSLKDLDKAYKNFFRGIKKGQKIGFPKFKKFNSSIEYNNQVSEYSREKHKIKLAKLKWIKVIDYKPAFGKLMNITVSKSKDNKWYASICVEQEAKEEINLTNNNIGIDVGIKDFLVTSNGEKIENPKFLEKSEKKLKKFQRRLSKKKIGSRNRKKARILVAKYFAKVTSQRKNFLNQLSTRLVKENNFIAHENLNIKGMVNNHKLAKSISSVSWYEFFRQLEYKAKWYDCKIVKIGRFEPSSKTCNNCGYINDELTLNDREWMCPNCGAILDRDINAAKNILKVGLKICETVVI
jgi:putative transposase